MKKPKFMLLFWELLVIVVFAVIVAVIFLVNYDAQVRICQVNGGGFVSFAVRTDGTVLYAGDYSTNQWKATHWEGVKMITSDYAYAAGLMRNGTVKLTNPKKEMDTTQWKNITYISGGMDHLVGLRNDATVVATGSNGYGQCEVSQWRDIVAISAGRNHTIALTASGRVFAVGDNTYNQCFVQNMNDIQVNKQ
jgi:alpha-tubulin suppressor-like RCC1 family protein